MFPTSHSVSKLRQRRFGHSAILVIAIATACNKSPIEDVELASLATVAQPSDDAVVRATAIASRASVQDLILFEKLIMHSGWDKSEDIVRDLYESKVDLEKLSPNNAFLLSPGTADNVAFGATILGNAAAALESVNPLGKVGSAIEPIANIASAIALKLGRTIDEDERVERALSDANSIPRFDAGRHALAERLVEVMQRKPNAATAFDAFFAKDYKVTSTSQKSEILAAYPTLAVLASLKNGVIPQLDSIDKHLAQTTSLIQEVHDAQFAQLVDTEWLKKIETLGAVSGFFSQVVGRTDAAFARQIDTISGSALKIASVLRDERLGRITTAAMTFSIAGTVMSAISALSASGPSVNERLLARTAEIAAAVEQLRSEMHARFDRIDQKLDQLLVLSAESFRKIRHDLVAIRSDLLQAKQAIADLSWQVAHVGATLSAMMQAEAARDLRSSNDSCLGVAERTGIALDYSGFVKCESDLWIAGVSFPSDALSLAPAYDTKMPDHLLGTELGRTVGENARFLTTLLRHRFGFSPTGTPANRETWAMAASSYAALGEENQWLDQRIARSRRDALISGGASLVEASRGVLLTSGNEPNYATFDKLVDFVGEKCAQLDKQGATEEVWTQSTFANQALRAFNLWGGATQERPADAAAFEPQVMTVPPCSGTGSTLQAPAGVSTTSWLSRGARDWIILSKSTPKTCHMAEFVNLHLRAPSPNVYVGYIQLTIDTTMEKALIGRQQFKTSQEFLSVEGSGVYDAQIDVLPACWNDGYCSFSLTMSGNIRALLLSPGPEELTPAEIAARDAATTAGVNSALSAGIADVDMDIASKFAEPGDLRNAAMAVDAAQRLVQSVLVLGDENAFESDDLLTLFGTAKPSLDPDSLAARFAKAASSPDLTVKERTRVQTDCAAWQTLAKSTIHSFLDVKAKELNAGVAYPSSVEQTLARLRSQFDGPYGATPAAPDAMFPFVRTETAQSSATVVDVRWSNQKPPNRLHPTGVWTFSSTLPLDKGVRICVEPQRNGDRLAFFDGAQWTVAATEPDFEWLCSTASATPAAFALVVPNNQAPTVKCHNVQVDWDGFQVYPISPADLVQIIDLDGDSYTLTATPPELSTLGAHSVTISATDAYGGVGSCNATVELVASGSGAGGIPNVPGSEAGTGGTAGAVGAVLPIAALAGSSSYSGAPGVGTGQGEASAGAGGSDTASRAQAGTSAGTYSAGPPAGAAGDFSVAGTGGKPTAGSGSGLLSCIPGDQKQCACPDDAPDGIQQCTTNGSGYGACVCSHPQQPQKPDTGCGCSMAGVDETGSRGGRAWLVAVGLAFLLRRGVRRSSTTRLSSQ